jgi:hypothetical protein
MTSRLCCFHCCMAVATALFPCTMPVHAQRPLVVLEQIFHDWEKRKDRVARVKYGLVGKFFRPAGGWSITGRSLGLPARTLIAGR